jgi:EpsI family protein
MAAKRIASGAALAGLAIIALLGHAWTRAADALAAEMPPRIFLPDVPGWHRVDYAPRVWWEPRAGGADHRLLGRYADAEGREVDVFLALSASQREGSEAGGFGEGGLPSEGAWAWLSPGPAVDGASSARLLAQGRIERLTETSFRTGGLTTGSNAQLKLANMRDRMLLRAQPTILLILSAEEHRGKPAADAIARFRRATGPLDQWMDRVAAVR